VSRKCKVCGERTAMPHGWCTWCVRSFHARIAEDSYEAFDFTAAAEWGAKRRAAAKAGGE